MKRNFFWQFIFVLALAVFIVTIALSITILFRPFYYQNIKILKLEEETGASYEEIKAAYDDVMDFLLKGKELHTGALTDPDSIAHFRDVRSLFILNFVLNAISLIIVVGLKILAKKKIISLRRNGISLEMWSVVSIGAFFIPLIVWGLIDFDSLFTVFHHVFFPGKTNWTIADRIVDYLPLKVWISFTLLIVGLILVPIVVIFIREMKMRQKRKKKA